MKKHYLGIICLIYAGIIIYVILTNTLKNFLAPQMQKYLIASILPLLIIGVVMILNNKVNYKFKISDLFLLLPLLMLFIAGSGNLTASFASNRMNNFTNTENTLKEKENKKEDIKESNTQENNTEEFDFSKVDFDIIDESYDTLAMLMTYEDKIDKLEGKTIRVKGFALKQADYIPNKYFALGKYEISCCSADASFIGFFAKYDKTKIKSNKWYEIEGVLEKGKDVAGYTIAVINVINIKEIDKKNEEQYVYACYVYDNGNCSELDKYQEYLN